ncbi:hypothetical protein Tco_0669721 [Tanacetum coccineum]
METKVPLTKDEEAFDVDVHLYRSMIGSLMYLTASRPDIMYAVLFVPRIRESPFDLEAFSDSDYGGSNLDRKSTTRYALTSNPTIYDSLVKQFWQTATANTKADGSLEINATIDTIGYTITEASIRDSYIRITPQGITMFQMMNYLRGWAKWRPVFNVSSFFANDFEYSNGKQTPLSGCQEHELSAPSQPTSSTPPVPSTSLLLHHTTPTPIPATIPTPPPIPETEPEPFEHTLEEPSPVHKHLSPPQEQAQ